MQCEYSVQGVPYVPFWTVLGRKCFPRANINRNAERTKHGFVYDPVKLSKDPVCLTLLVVKSLERTLSSSTPNVLLHVEIRYAGALVDIALS